MAMGGLVQGRIVLALGWYGHGFLPWIGLDSSIPTHTNTKAMGKVIVHSIHYFRHLLSMDFPKQALYGTYCACAHG